LAVRATIFASSSLTTPVASVATSFQRPSLELSSTSLETSLDDFLAESLHKPYKQVCELSRCPNHGLAVTKERGEEKPMSEMSGWQLSGDAPTAYTASR
jgi:hypothetical protein